MSETPSWLAEDIVSEWEEKFSDKHNRKYWRHRESGKTSWTSPEPSAFGAAHNIHKPTAAPAAKSATPSWFQKISGAVCGPAAMPTAPSAAKSATPSWLTDEKVSVVTQNKTAEKASPTVCVPVAKPAAPAAAKSATPSWLTEENVSVVTQNKTAQKADPTVCVPVAKPAAPAAAKSATPSWLTEENVSVVTQTKTPEKTSPAVCVPAAKPTTAPAAAIDAVNSSAQYFPKSHGAAEFSAVQAAPMVDISPPSLPSAEASTVNRMVDTNVLEDGRLRSPLAGMFPPDLPLVSLEAALAPFSAIVAGLPVAIRIAMKKAKKLEKGFPHMSSDERAAIVLYTMEAYPQTQSVSKQQARTSQRCVD
jgi:hypothetical protein